MMVRVFVIFLTVLSLYGAPVLAVGADAGATSLGASGPAQSGAGGLEPDNGAVLRDGIHTRPELDEAPASWQIAQNSANLSAEQVAKNKRAQRALKHFEYRLGKVDGLMGPKTRSAIRAFERDMGFNVNGRLNTRERRLLVQTFRQSRAGDYGPYGRVVAAYGPNGLLRAKRGEQTGELLVPEHLIDPVDDTEIANGPIEAPDDTMATRDAPMETVAPDRDVEPGWTPVDSTEEPDAIGREMTQLCNDTNTISLANGGLMDAANLSNPTQALNEQFCQARQYVTNQGIASADALDDESWDSVDKLCERISGTLADVVAAIPDQPPEQIVEMTRSKVDEVGSRPADFVSEARMCLGLAYEAGDPVGILSSSLLLVAAGHSPYGEIVGHHLREGFGIPQNAERAKQWHLSAIEAMESGTPPDILPNQSANRNALIRKALGAATPDMSASDSQ